MNGDFRFDMTEVLKNIDTAEVLALYLPLIQKTLLADYRYDAEEGPMIRLVPMAHSIEDRYRSLKRLRPHFDRPESITLIPWPKRIKSLLDTGVWDRIVRRFMELGYPDLINESKGVFELLLQAERDEILAAVKGDQYHTLWERVK